MIFRTFLIFFTLSTHILSQEYWQEIQTPIQSRLTTIFAHDSSNIWVGADSGIILYTSDKGENWAVQNTQSGKHVKEISFYDSLNGWAVAYNQEDIDYRSYILKTSNGGNSWDVIPFRFEGIFLYTIVLFDSLNCWVAGDEIFYTNDGGINWLSPTIEYAPFAYFPMYKLKFYSREKGIAVGGYQDFVGVAWRTNDSGYTWTPSGLGPDLFYDVYLKDSITVLALSSELENLYPIGSYRTDDFGLNWQIDSISLSGVVSAIDFRTELNGWATKGRDNLAMFTEDGGYNWELYALSDSNAVHDVEFLDSLNGFMAGENGKFYVYQPDEPSKIVVEENNIVDEFILFQNFPNPFNSSTTIKFRIPQSEARGFVSLKVYDILGNEVATLVNEYKTAEVYEIDFDSSRLTSGIYFYQLKTNSSIETKKMILLK